ncbi:hypothetical protein QOT17_014767 [Balamuthia mandrillaris]
MPRDKLRKWQTLRPIVHAIAHAIVHYFTLCPFTTSLQSFCFDFNDQTFKEGLLAASSSSSSSGNKNTIAKQTEVHKAMFTVHNPSSSIYLVLRAERLFFDGKLDKDNKEKHFYVKPKVCKGKGLKEIEKTVSQAITNYKGE